MPRLTEILVGDNADLWRAAGFTVADDVCQVGHVGIRFTNDLGRGMRGWAFDESVPGDDIDGLVSRRATEVQQIEPHPNGVDVIDHVVVVTPDLPRTIAELEHVGFELRRTRDTDTYGTPMRQAFFKAGDVILEIVGGQQPDRAGGSSRFFGLAFTVESMDATASLLGASLGKVKPAVQQGRSIATLRAGQTVPIVLMTR